jgi:hypothetical protein
MPSKMDARGRTCREMSKFRIMRMRFLQARNYKVFCLKSEQFNICVVG